MTTAIIDVTPVVLKGDAYKLLAACFCEPEKKLFLEEHVCQNLARILAQSSPKAAEQAEKMLGFLQEYDQQKLSIDHAALFVGPFELIAAPYGSVWMERPRLVMGDSTMNVKQFYEEAELQADVAEPPDHIAIMLEFMSWLCRREAEAVSFSATDDSKRYADLKKRFLNQALSPWVADFCNAIVNGIDNKFYVSLATVLYLFIDSEREAYS